MNSPDIASTSNGFCSIGIYLYGESLSLDDASQLLGLTPTKARNRGEVRVTSSGSEVVQKIGFWEFSIHVELGEINSAIAKLIDEIDCSRVLGFAGVEKAELDIFVPVDEEQVGFSFELPTSALRKLTELGLDVVITSR